MAIRPKYLIEALEGGNIMTIAEALARYHAPSVKFKATLAPKESHYDFKHKKKKILIIQWAVGDGLTTLLHELGHHACKHNKLECCDGKKIEEEAEAWLWAEKWAVRHGIRFDYPSAEKAFDYCQLRRAKLLINWAHRHFFGDLEHMEYIKEAEK